MPRKKDEKSTKGGKVLEFEPPLVFPTHDEIEQGLQRRLHFWEDPEHKVRYPIPVLDFLINEVGCERQTLEDDPEFGKDTEFYNPFWYTTGITNGELFYSVYRTVRQMTSDERFEFCRLPLCDQEAFFSMLDLGICLFLDRRKEVAAVDDSNDLWILYRWTRELEEFALWTNDSSEPLSPPPIEQLTDEDWKDIAEDVKEHFSEDGDEEYLEIALLDEQLHWPTFQEFRSAKAHLLNWYGRTRANNQPPPD